jgi:hypothetical protein
MVVLLAVAVHERTVAVLLNNGYMPVKQQYMTPHSVSTTDVTWPTLTCMAGGAKRAAQWPWR